MESNLQKQQKLRERAENYSKELESEMETMRQARANAAPTPTVDNSAELQKLRQELEHVRLE